MKYAGFKYDVINEKLSNRPCDPDLYTDGIPDYEKISESNPFQSAMDFLKSETEKGERIALLGYSSIPENCQRALMFGRAFAHEGYEVKHILPSGGYETQDDFEKRLLLFHGDEISESDSPLDEAYRIRNRKAEAKVYFPVAPANNEF